MDGSSVKVEFSHDELIHQIHCLLVDGAAAGDPHMMGALGLGNPPRQLERLLKGMHHQGLGRFEVGRTRDHDIRPPGQGPSESHPGAAPHDNRTAQSRLLKMREIRGNTPQHVCSRTEDTLDVLGPNRGENRHTATGALIAGWCS